MSARPILIDTTRLLTRLRHASPSGIDRVDLAYARRFLTGQPDRRAVAITPAGPRLLPPARLDWLMASIGERWREEIPAGQDPVLARIRGRLGGAAEGAPAGQPAPARHARPRLAAIGAALRSGAALRWPAVSAAPEGAVYLHTSHLRLDKPRHFAWLAARPDVRPVFFVHDLIPIEYPEYVVPGEDERHRVRMATMARHAAAVIANSEDVRSRFRAFLSGQGLREPPVAVAPLGIEPAFLGTHRAPGKGRPYLVVCSTIEARKNHLMLLQAWRELVARHGSDVPALVIVGRRGWESEAAVDLLDRCPSLRPHVLEASGLSTPALAELLAGARGLLMPSFAEGYGIPIAEALAVGTPVVASDIPVHREVAGAHATFVHPLDGPGWMDAIMRVAAGGAGGHPGPYRPPTWDGHFAIVEDVLRSL